MAFRLPNPVVVLPGITASGLRDVYPVDPEGVWNYLPGTKDYRRVALHPEDRRYEGVEPGRQPVRILPDAVFGIPYKELIEELRYNLASDPDEPVPVYPFAYDWRMPLEDPVEELAAMIDEVIGRTRLLRHYGKSGWADDPRVNLVGHSMGGLIIAGYLRRFGGEKVGKVASLGTPFQGSHEAQIKVATGTADWGVDCASREREAARLTPSLYYLLPKYAGAVKWKNGRAADLFKLDNWQRGVVYTIATCVEKHAPRKPRKREARKRAEEILGEMLNSALKYRETINKANSLSELGLSEGAWLSIVGIGAETRTEMTIERERRSPEFDLSSAGRKNHWGEDDPDSTETGDGTVPFLGSVPSFLPRRELVCVAPRDFGYWEIMDRALVKASGFHGMLPKLNLAHRLIVAHFLSDPKRKGIWGRRPPGIGAAEWSPPLDKLRDKGAM